MRRTVVALVAALCTGGGLLSGLPASAEEPTPAAPSTPVGPTEPPTETPSDSPADTPDEQALEVATELLQPADDTAPATPPQAPSDVTLAMRDLFYALPGLDGAARRQARKLLARPESPDAAGSTASRRALPAPKCTIDICVHYTDDPSSPHYATSQWAQTTLNVMTEVWNHTAAMGYRRPLSDAGSTTSGNLDGRFDVYLQNTGAGGAFGYCKPDPQQRGSRVFGFCVLDNDFNHPGWGDPMSVMRVTAAHEFFHAVQFGYDAREDRWFMESTATWIEDTYADAVNDNRNYLRFSQLRRPATSLDTYSPTGFAQYGNWIFWQYLSERHGDRIVRKTWQKAEARGKRNRYSTKALAAALRGRGGLTKNFRTYAAANVVRGKAYDEGSSWPRASVSAKWRLGPGERRTTTTKLNHLAARHFMVQPKRGAKRGHLRVNIDGPRAVTRPAALVTIQKKNGKSSRKVVRLSRQGNGSALVAFDRRTVRAVTVTVVNGSTRFRACGKRRNSAPRDSCLGAPVDQRLPFRLAVAAVR